jgi:hypothetical protein
MMEIVLLFEGEHVIHTEDYETIPDNLESISRIAAFIARKHTEGVG